MLKPIHALIALVFPFILACNDNAPESKRERSSSVDDTEMYLQLAEFFLDENMLDSAQKYFFVFTEFEPENPGGPYGLGFVFMQKNQYDRAVDQFTQVVRKHAGYRNALYNRAWCLYKMDEPERALRDVNKGLELKPNNPDFLAFRAELNVALKNFPEALEDINTAIELNPNDGSYYVTLAQYHLAKKDSASACRVFSLSVEKGFLDAEAVPFCNL
ncbi:MAG: tetratricopeptide repeat protein [Luteibaculaceae bacterium]